MFCYSNDSQFETHVDFKKFGEVTVKLLRCRCLPSRAAPSDPGLFGCDCCPQARLHLLQQATRLQLRFGSSTASLLPSNVFNAFSVKASRAINVRLTPSLYDSKLISAAVLTCAQAWPTKLQETDDLDTAASKPDKIHRRQGSATV
jgi:hypothetical protein